MQADDGRSPTPPYLFARTTSEALDTLSVQGRGPPCKPNGLTRSLFRPSDDAVTLPYHIPGNAMACVELRHAEALLRALPSELKKRAAALLQRAHSIGEALCAALLPLSQDATQPLPYETDGFGSLVRMDDANLPSLLALPVLGYMSAQHASYQATRAFVLSRGNPYFYAGAAGSGVGGPHEGVGLVWPMAVIVQAMTSQSAQEVEACLQVLKSTTAGTGLMHEAFDVDDAATFTRPWFAWCNALFGELILQLLLTRPELLLQDTSAASLAKVAQLVRAPISLQAQREALLA
jgi:meiotically up-regulated gene 157 (Mug157) protein